MGLYLKVREWKGNELYMAHLQLDFYADSLKRTVPVQIILPNDIPWEIDKSNIHYQRKTKIVILLHGYSGTEKDWMLNSPVQEMAIQYNLAIIMPAGNNSFYLDGKATGQKYGTFIGKELIEYVVRTFHFSNKKEDYYIGGYSMGGFGAINAALAYPESFCKVFALSSALIIHDIKNMKVGESNGVANYDYYKEVFGELTELEFSKNNPEFLISEYKRNKIEIPPIFMACGLEDFLLDQNRAFHKFLVKEKIAHVYRESVGNHNWSFWKNYLEPAIQWMLDCEV
jgi:S-formylglutathione hydrolase FrmB